MTEYILQKSEQNKKMLFNELKMYVNKKLFEQKLISEEMYRMAKDALMKQAL